MGTLRAGARGAYDERVKVSTRGDYASRALLSLALHDGVGPTSVRDIAERTGLLDGLEVSSEVFDSPANIAIDQAENRLHTIKAILVATLA